MSGSNGDAPWMQGVSAANQARSLYGYGAKAYPWVSSQVSGAANSLGSAAPAASAAETGASAAGTAEAGAGAAAVRCRLGRRVQDGVFGIPNDEMGRPG